MLLGPHASRGSDWCLLGHVLAVGVACIPLEQVMAAAAHAGSWSLYRVSCCLRACVGKEAPLWCSCPSPCVIPQQWSLALLGGPGFFHVHSQLPYSSAFRLSPCSQPQSSSQMWSLKFELQHPPTACTSGLASQAGECREAILTTCAKSVSDLPSSH